MIIVLDISKKKSTLTENQEKQNARASSNLDSSDSEEERPSVEDYYKFMEASL